MHRANRDTTIVRRSSSNLGQLRPPPQLATSTQRQNVDCTEVEAGREEEAAVRAGSRLARRGLQRRLLWVSLFIVACTLLWFTHIKGVLQLGIVSSMLLEGVSRYALGLCGDPSRLGIKVSSAAAQRSDNSHLAPRTEPSPAWSAPVSFKLFALPPYPRAISALLAQRIA